MLIGGLGYFTANRYGKIEAQHKLINCISIQLQNPISNFKVFIECTVHLLPSLKHYQTSLKETNITLVNSHLLKLSEYFNYHKWPSILPRKDLAAATSILKFIAKLSLKLAYFWLL